LIRLGFYVVLILQLSKWKRLCVVYHNAVFFPILFLSFRDPKKVRFYPFAGFLNLVIYRAIMIFFYNASVEYLLKFVRP